MALWREQIHYDEQDFQRYRLEGHRGVGKRLLCMDLLGATELIVCLSLSFQ